MILWCLVLGVFRLVLFERHLAEPRGALCKYTLSLSSVSLLLDAITNKLVFVLANTDYSPKKKSSDAGSAMIKNIAE